MASLIPLRIRLGDTARTLGAWITMLAFSNVAFVPLGWAGPSGENVVRGDVSIAREGATTTIRASDRSIIEFRQFDIAANEGVEFVQPAVESRVLNRILGGTPTSIDGTLTANGQVFIVNRAGIVFGRSAIIDVGGLIAAAGTISNEDFLGNGDIFTELSGPVANFGRIDAERVALLGQSVENAGAISAPGGVIALVAADAVYLTQQGSDVVVKLPNPEASLRVVDPGEGGRGVIVADDTNLAVGDLHAFAMGEDAAADDVGGAVDLSPGEVVVSGTLDAASDSGVGGQISLLGTEIRVDDARLDASGVSGGGRIRIGGERGGAGGPNPERIFVDDGALLAADALRAGDGGEIVVFADGEASVNGTLTARGGALSGNGGFVETSGRRLLEVTRAPDVSAPAGRGGSWLLDPIDIEIFNAENEPPVLLFGMAEGSVFGRSRIDVGLINDALSRGTTVTIDTSGEATQVGNITQRADALISFVPSMGEGSPSSASLFLFADNDILLNAGIDALAPLNVTLDAIGNIDLGGSIATGGGRFQAAAGGAVTIAAPLQTLAGGGLSVSADAISVGAPILSGASLTFESPSIDILADVSAEGNLRFQSRAPGSLFGGQVELGQNVALRSGTRIDILNSQIVLGVGGVNRFAAPFVAVSDLVDLRETDTGPVGSFQIDASRVLISSVDIGGDAVFNLAPSGPSFPFQPFIGLGLDLGVDDANGFLARNVSVNGPGVGGSEIPSALSIFSPIATSSGDVSIRGFDSVGVFAPIEAARDLSIAQVSDVGIGGSAGLVARGGDLSIVDEVGRIQLEAGNSRSSNPSDARGLFLDDPSQQQGHGASLFRNEFRAGGSVALAPIARGVYSRPEPGPDIPGEAPDDAVTHDVAIAAGGAVDLAGVDLSALERREIMEGVEVVVPTDEVDGALAIQLGNDPAQSIGPSSRVRGDLTAASIEISSASGAGSIDLDANVDLTTTSGDLSASDGVARIGLLGSADTANVLTATGAVDLAPVVGGAGADLVVSSGGSTQLRGVDVLGSLAVSVDTLGPPSVESLIAGPLVASSLRIAGRGNDDLLSFAGATRARGGSFFVPDAGAIALLPGASISAAADIDFGESSGTLALGASSALEAGVRIEGRGLTSIELLGGAEPVRLSAAQEIGLAPVRAGVVPAGLGERVEPDLGLGGVTELELLAGTVTLDSVSGLDRLLVSVDPSGLGGVSSLQGDISVGALTLRSSGGVATFEIGEGLATRATSGALSASDGIARLRLLGEMAGTTSFSAATSLALGPTSGIGATGLQLTSGGDLMLAGLDLERDLELRFGGAGQGATFTATGALRASSLLLQGTGALDRIVLTSSAMADLGDLTLQGVGATEAAGDLTAAGSLVVGSGLTLRGEGAQRLASGMGEIAFAGDVIKTSAGSLTLDALTARFTGAATQQLMSGAGELIVAADIVGTPMLLALGGSRVALQGVQLDGALTLALDADGAGTTSSLSQDVTVASIRVSSDGGQARVELAAGVDLMATNGSLDLDDGIAALETTGASGTTNQLVAPMGSIELAPLVGAGGAAVALQSGTDTTLSSVALSGPLSVQLGGLGSGALLSSRGALMASGVQIVGSGPQDAVALGGDVLAGVDGLVIDGVGSITSSADLTSVADVFLGSDVLLGGGGMQRLRSISGELILAGGVSKPSGGDLALDALTISLVGPGDQVLSVPAGSLVLGGDLSKSTAGDLIFDAPIIEFSDADDRADLGATTVSGLFANQVTGARSASIEAQQGSVLLNSTRTRSGDVRPTLVSTGNLAIDSAERVSTGATEVFAVNGSLVINAGTGVDLPDTVALGLIDIDGGDGPIRLLGTAPTASFSVPILSPNTGINVLGLSVNFATPPQTPSPLAPGVAPVIATLAGEGGFTGTPSAGFSALLTGDPSLASFGGGVFQPFGSSDAQQSVNIAAVSSGLGFGSPSLALLAGGFLPFADRSITLDRPVTLDESLEWLECVLNEDCDPDAEGFDDPRLAGDEKEKLKEMYAELFGRTRQLSDRRALEEVLDAYRARPDAADQIDPRTFVAFLRANPEESAVALRYLADLNGLVVQWRKAQDKTERIELGAACMLSNGLRLDSLEPSELYAIVTGTALSEPGLCPGGRR